MRPYIIITLFFLTLASCRSGQNKTTGNVDYLSKWYNANEDSLYNEFVNHVQNVSLCNNCGDTTWGEVAFQRSDTPSYMGRFTLQAKKYCDSLEVTYFYNKSTTPKTRILLSAAYNRNLTKALDTILNFTFPKRFKIDKYEQPDLTSDIFSIENIDIIKKDLRIDIKPHDALHDLTVFIHGSPKSKTIDDEDKQYLQRQLFGEELLLKKINVVEFQFTDTINNSLATLEETRLKLK
jgi:hypothetical protein